MAQLSEREKIFLLIMRVWDNFRPYRQIQNLFNREFSNGENQTQISLATITRTIQWFAQTGSIANQPKSGRPSTNEDTKLEILQSFIENPQLSIRGASAQLVVPKSSVYQVMKSLKFHPYKIHLVQELNENDPDRWNEFCEIMMNMINDDASLLQRIVFSDESTFTLHSEMKEQNTQYPCEVNVWAGILDDRVIGSFFIEDNLNAEKYAELLQNQVIPKIREVAGDDFDSIWFQQDGAPPHYGRNVRALLDEEFPGRWMGRRGAIDWPARSPNHTS